MSNQLFDYFFGPLPKHYCLFFTIITIYLFIVFVIAVAKFIHFLLTSKSNLDFEHIFAGLVSCSYLFIFYFLTRLFSGMCKASL